MGNHFIPQAYLKRFSSGDNLIWAHPRDREPFQAGIRVIAQENDLYSDEVEKYFNEEIEKPCLPVFAKIDSKTPLNAFDKAHLTNYAIDLMLRKPTDRERTKEWTKQNAGRLYKETEKEFNERFVNGDPDSDKMRNSLEKMKRMPNFGLNHFEIWEACFDKENFERTKSEMKKMNWCIYTTGQPAFVTSDNPVQWRTGLMDPDAEVVFPLSSYRLLHLSWKETSYEYFPATQDIVDEANEQVGASADRFVFAHAQLDDMADQFRNR